MFKQNKPIRPAIDSLIGLNTQIQGDIHFQGGLRIDGKVTGNVIGASDLKTMLVLSEKAKVEGEVKAAHVVVNGTIVGPVTATHMLELQPHAHIIGNVQYVALEMHPGAVISGCLTHQNENNKPELKLASTKGVAA